MGNGGQFLTVCIDQGMYFHDDPTPSLCSTIENDLETNFCLLRRIKCNLPYRQNWMQFLTGLTQKDREAAFSYYKVSPIKKFSFLKSLKIITLFDDEPCSMCLINVYQISAVYLIPTLLVLRHQSRNVIPMIGTAVSLANKGVGRIRVSHKQGSMALPLPELSVALKEVRQRGRCISSVHRLLALLSKEKSGDEELMLTIQHLTISNTACEGLCYDIWLRLLEMIIFLESFRPQKTIDKSAISAFHHLRNWQKELSDGGKRVWKLANENEPLTKRRRAQLWYSCFNDRLLLEKLENKDQSSGGESSRHVTFENGQNLLKSVRKQLKSLVPEDPSFHSPDIAMSDGVLTNDRVDGCDNKPKISSNVTEAGTNSTNKHFEDDPISSKLSGLLNLKQFGGTRKLSLRTGSGVLNTSSKDDTERNVRSPASISHSEARKLISEMSTGSDIIRTPSPELARLGTTMGNSGKNAHRLDSYLAAAEAAEMFVAQLHSNSNVEISTIVLRKSCSDDHLLKAAMARTRSLNDLDGPHTDKTISLSHSLDDITTYPFDASEHLMSAWDNYQACLDSSFQLI
ncbi:hypothetical protein ACTXT7_002272 [Hymenolepis weldensis]